MAKVILQKVLSELRAASGIGWQYAETGGGCTALESEVVNGRYHLITDGGCFSVNEVEGSSYLRGISIDTDCTWTLGTYLKEDDGQEAIADFDTWQDLINGVSNLGSVRGWVSYWDIDSDDEVGCWDCDWIAGPNYEEIRSNALANAALYGGRGVDDVPARTRVFIFGVSHLADWNNAEEWEEYSPLSFEVEGTREVFLDKYI